MEALERRISSVGGGGASNGDNDDAVTNASNIANEVWKHYIGDYLFFDPLNALNKSLPSCRKGCFTQRTTPV